MMRDTKGPEPGKTVASRIPPMLNAVPFRAAHARFDRPGRRVD